jgi:uncharacterized protein (DUF1800 family)
MANPGLALESEPASDIRPEEACLFLMQASFGPTLDEIEHLQKIGFAQWIDDQLATPPGRHLPVLRAMKGKVEKGNIFHHHRVYVWWQQSLTSEDQLRQRMAYAWSQIFVVSDVNNVFTNHTDALADYYDTLLVNGLGNFRDLLRAVTYHPCMAAYLTYLKNEKGDAEGRRRPDENYAREIMQLFTIGLYELNADGTRRLKNGRPIPTYINDDVREMARVFTGLSFAGSALDEGGFRWGKDDFITPLAMYPDFHDRGEKPLLGGKTLPAGQEANKDIEDALDMLFQHPNNPPFICRLLIQRLTTSNPSRSYLRRVAQVYIDNGKSVRGDLAAVARAILLDPEARQVDAPPDQGKQREPYLRLVALVRAFKGAPARGDIYEVAYLGDLLGQEPGSSPSVFNFYSPDYSPPGPISDAGLVAPEFQITNAVTAVSLPNFMRDCVYQGAIGRWGKNLILDFSQILPLAGRPEDLVDRLNLLIAGARMSRTTRQIIANAVSQIPSPDANGRVKLAVYLASICAESAVQP